MGLDRIFKATGNPLQHLLLPFVRWLREDKDVKLPASDKEIVDEWCGIAMGQVSDLYSRLKDILSDAPKDEDDEIPVDPPGTN